LLTAFQHNTSAVPRLNSCVYLRSSFVRTHPVTDI